MAPTNDRRPIVAYASEDGRLGRIRREAETCARDRAATLILYDIDAAAPLEGSPLPTNWSSDIAGANPLDRLSPEDLEKAGRPAIASQVREARADGIDAWAWLPQDPGGDALGKYVARVGAGMVLVPAELESPGLVDRLEGKTLHEARDEVPAGVEVRVVG